MTDLNKERERLAAEQAAKDGQDGGDNAASVAQRAENGEGGGKPDDEPQAELFPDGVIDGDPRVTIKNLIRGGENVDLEVTLMQGKVPLRGGLVDPRRSGKVVVSHDAAKYLLIPQREGEPGDKKVKGWTVRCQLKPTYSEPASAYWTEEEVMRLVDALGIPRSSDKVVELLKEHREAA